MTPSLSPRTTNLVRFPADLRLPPGDPKLFDNAAEAVRHEYRNSVRWKRLRCRDVARLAGHEENPIFVLDVGQSVEFDWSWEGAIAFRASDPGSFVGNIDSTADFVIPSTGDNPTDGPSGSWMGEIVEVDETNGRLFVAGSPEFPPFQGTFFVRPFEFLAFLNSLFSELEYTGIKHLLPARLNASRGGIHPVVSDGGATGLAELAEMWGHSWSVLWGPPGCGKTTGLGEQVAACLGGRERILVVSTTNKATDAAALAIGKAARNGRDQGRVLRIGKGADHDAYDRQGLTDLLRGTETDLLRQVGTLARELDGATTHEQKAVLRSRIQELRRQMKDNAFNIFVSEDVSVVVSTAFKAITLLADPALRSQVAGGGAPFTTVVIDEAGLMPRAVVAGMSLLASRRVMVVGDAKQLAPISKMSRVLPTAQATWLGSSCLTHLQQVRQAGPAVHLLREQHRMHPQISKAVSEYQYEGALRDSPAVTSRGNGLPPLLAGHARAVWYVLDEDGQELPSIRAERGPGNRSWIRPATREVLRKLFSEPEVRKACGLFITPFKAQARDIAAYFASEGLKDWSAGTVHGRQGTEADVVVFDTVNAGSHAWPYDEWKRLVNVGLSRAREFVLVLASRAEMAEPYLRSLQQTLAARILKRSGKAMAWTEVAVLASGVFETLPPSSPDILGGQIARRKALRPVMSGDQQRLCGLGMDGKPRLVRGVAGSGKTWVLAHWLHRTVQKLSDQPDARVWAVYANKSLHGLIEDTIEQAWKPDGGVGPSPLERAQLHHVRNLLQSLSREAGLPVSNDDFDYDEISARYLQRVPFEKVKPRCQAMFIDEAQDMGPHTLRLLSALVEPLDPANPGHRAMNIFYDNAQNIYGRRAPKWSDMGLDMRGRSTVMKESFRSTRPITEFALNVLYTLQPPDADPDHKELVERGLVERAQTPVGPWWKVRFNQVEGPVPLFRKFTTLEDQIEALGKQVVRWVREDGVRPGDICVLYNGQNIKYRLEQQVAPLLKDIGTGLAFVGDQGWNRSNGPVLASTSHSYKGYESEVVVLAGVEQFTAKDKGILANNLYVAMTRARSLLAVYAYSRKNPDEETRKLLATLQKCMDTLVDRPAIEPEISDLDDFEDVLGRLGSDHRDWLAGLWKTRMIQQEPIVAEDGELIAEPLFWFQIDDRMFACFGNQGPGTHTLHKLQDNKIEVVRPGETPSK